MSKNTGSTGLEIDDGALPSSAQGGFPPLSAPDGSQIPARQPSQAQASQAHASGAATPKASAEQQRGRRSLHSVAATAPSAAESRGRSRSPLGRVAPVANVADGSGLPANISALVDDELGDYIPGHVKKEIKKQTQLLREKVIALQRSRAKLTMLQI